jgi:hypothetical protein
LTSALASGPVKVTIASARAAPPGASAMAQPKSAAASVEQFLSRSMCLSFVIFVEI